MCLSIERILRIECILSFERMLRIKSILSIESILSIDRMLDIKSMMDILKRLFQNTYNMLNMLLKSMFSISCLCILKTNIFNMLAWA